MTEESLLSVEFIYCVCGCGKTTSKYQFESGRVRKDRQKKFIEGHQNNGRKFSDEVKKKLSETRKGKPRPKFSEEWKKNLSEAHKGYKHTEQSNVKRSIALKGERNSQWKANDVGYSGLHVWINKYLPKQDLCQICKLVPPRDVACITGIYNRDFNNWKRLCRKCHLLFDNIIERNLIEKGKLTRFKKKVKYGLE